MCFTEKNTTLLTQFSIIETQIEENSINTDLYYSNINDMKHTDTHTHRRNYSRSKAKEP